MQTKYQPPPGVVLSNLLTIRGREAAHRWLAEALGATVPLDTVRKAASGRKIKCVQRGRALYFSTQSLWDWFAENYTAPIEDAESTQPQQKWYER